MSKRLSRALTPIMVIGCVLWANGVRAQPSPPPSAVGAAQSPASTDSADFDRGATLAADHQYVAAAAAFKAAFESDGRKEALFAWAQAERLAGHCPLAVGLYRQFLERGDLTPPQSEAAQLNLRRCQEVLANPPAKTPVASSLPALSLAQSSPSPPPARSPRATLIGELMLGAAVAAVAASATFFFLARNDEREASAADSWDPYYQAASRAHARQQWSAGLLGGGILLGGAALLEWKLSASHQARLEARIGAGQLWLTGAY
jgi:hypothetical protein